MKKHILNIAIIVLSAFNLYGQNEKFNTAVKTAVETLNNAKSADDFIAAANTFSRIAAAEPKEWLPNYYAAYANLTAGFITSGTDMDKAQSYMDNAQTLLNSAIKLAAQPADLSETGALQAYILIGKVIADPMTKGAELSPRIFQELGKASAMNPNNPRAPFLQGMYTMNMPEFYGGGAKNAKPFLEKAKTLFEAEVSDGIRPNWGKTTNESILKSVGEPAGNK